MSDDAIANTLRAGLAAHEAGRLEEAEGRFRQVLEVHPDNAEAQQLLATVLAANNQLTEAVVLFENCMPAFSHNPAIRCNYGIALSQIGRIDDAIEQFATALSEHGDFPTALFHLARLEKARGNLGRTVDLLGRLLKMHSGTFEALLMFGEALTGIGQLQAGRLALLQAAELARLDISKILTAGETLTRLKFFQEAVDVLKVALSINENSVPALVNTGLAYQGMKDFKQTFTCYHKALQLNPKLPETKANLASLYTLMGDAEAAHHLLQQLVHENPDNPRLHENLLFNCLYLLDYDGPALLEEARKYAQAHRGSSIKAIHNNARHPDKRLRIGYLSPDWKNHPAKLFFYPFFRAHNRADVEVFLYSATARADDWTRKFQAVADSWRDVSMKSPEQIAQQIRKDRIDILIDCAGYTAGQPMDVFKLKPAPIQATQFIFSTGLPQMDYYLSPDHTIPDHLPAEALYSEKIIEVPVQHPFEPADEVIAVSDLPALTNGYITFGCNANLAKLNKTTLTCWASILSQVQNARLVLKSPTLSDSYVRAYWWDLIESHGIATDRTELIGMLPRHEHVNHYAKIDIALDSFPFNGMATTMEFLWHGVPVISKAGNVMQARMGLNLLTTIGLDALVAETEEGYVQKAVLLASDIAGLSSIRSSLRPRIENSIMCKHKLLAAEFESRYRTMWQEWCHQ